MEERREAGAAGTELVTEQGVTSIADIVVAKIDRKSVV